jgi:xanthine dehydrogenase accessory factor
MDSLDLQVLNSARRWADEGRRFALVTVVQTWGSSPRPPGAWLALREDGAVEGSVSGGCIEDDLISRMREGRLTGPLPFTLKYGVTRDEAMRFGLPCGGTIELVVEPQPGAYLDLLAQRIGERHLVSRTLDMASGKVTLADASRGDTLQWDGSRLTTVHGPQWRMLLIGAGQLGKYLAPMALALDYEVIVCDPREEYASDWQVPGTTLVTTMPDDAVLALEPDARSVVVALTHDPKLDDMALLEALKSAAFYVGAVGSRATTAKRKQRLGEYFDLSQAELDRLHGPVGLYIGSHTPPEIAVSILAEITAVRNGVTAAGRPAAQGEDTSAVCRAG